MQDRPYYDISYDFYPFVSIRRFYPPQVLCFQVRAQVMPNGDLNVLFYFNDKKMQDCTFNGWDTGISKYVTNPNQGPNWCPYDDVDGTGLEGWGTPNGKLGYYLGFSDNGYFAAPQGDNHWTTTTCVKKVTYIPNSSPPIYQLEAYSLNPTDTCNVSCCYFPSSLLFQLAFSSST